MERISGNSENKESGKWFYGKLSRTDAEEILKSCNYNAFLIRESSQSSSYALSYWFYGKKELGHSLLFLGPKGGWKLEKSDMEYETLSAFVSNCPEIKMFQPPKNSSNINSKKLPEGSSLKIVAPPTINFSPDKTKKNELSAKTSAEIFEWLRGNRENELHLAIRSGNNSKLKSLLNSEDSRPLLFQRDEMGQTPLVLAVVTNKPEAVKLLLKHYSIEDLNSVDISGNILHKVMSSGTTNQTLNPIINLPGLKMDCLDNNGNLFLHKMCRSISFLDKDILLTIMNRIPDHLNYQNALGETPLHRCVGNADASIAMCLIKLLVLHLGDINIADNNGNTPLHLAVMDGRFNIAQLLLKLKANKTIKNKQQKTPLDIAQQLKNNELINLLQLSEYEFVKIDDLEAEFYPLSERKRSAWGRVARSLSWKRLRPVSGPLERFERNESRRHSNSQFRNGEMPRFLKMNLSQTQSPLISISEILTELNDSEITYIYDMKKFMNLIITPLSTKDSPLPKSDFRVLFSNFTEVINVAEKFSFLLSQAKNNPNATIYDISNLFLNSDSIFQIYNQYCPNCVSQLRLLELLIKNNSIFCETLQLLYSSETNSFKQTYIELQLLRPLKRMKEYVFLLELLQSNFQKIVSDFSVLETTIQPLRVVANESDSKVLTWKTECLIRLSNIQLQVPLGSQKMKKSGVIKRVSKKETKEEELILFSNHLLLLKYSGPQKIQLKYTIPLNTVSIEDTKHSVPDSCIINSFSQKKKFLIIFPSPLDLKLWIKSIQQQLKVPF